LRKDHSVAQARDRKRLSEALDQAQDDRLKVGDRVHALHPSRRALTADESRRGKLEPDVGTLICVRRTGLAPVGARDSADDRQSEPAAPIAPARRRPAESLEGAREEILGESVTAVEDVDLDSSLNLA